MTDERPAGIRVAAGADRHDRARSVFGVMPFTVKATSADTGGGCLIIEQANDLPRRSPSPRARVPGRVVLRRRGPLRGGGGRSPAPARARRQHPRASSGPARLGPPGPGRRPDDHRLHARRCHGGVLRRGQYAAGHGLARGDGRPVRAPRHARRGTGRSTSTTSEPRPRPEPRAPPWSRERGARCSCCVGAATARPGARPPAPAADGGPFLPASARSEEAGRGHRWLTGATRRSPRRDRAVHPLRVAPSAVHHGRGRACRKCSPTK